MAARPATRRAPTEDRSASPRVRDFRPQGSVPTIEWDVRTAYDFVFSLSSDAGSTDDMLPADRTWLTDARAGLRERFGESLDLYGNELCTVLAGLAVDRAGSDRRVLVRRPARCRRRRDDPADDRRRRPARPGAPGDRGARDRGRRGGHRDDGGERRHPPRQGLRELGRFGLPRTLDGHRARPADPGRVAGVVPRDRAARRRDDPPRLRGPGRRPGEPAAARAHRADHRRHPVAVRAGRPARHPRAVVLRAAVQLPARRRRAGGCSGIPIADTALDATDPLAPPAAVVRLHRALGDETRLRILAPAAGSGPVPDRDRPAARALEADHQAPPGAPALGRPGDRHRGRHRSSTTAFGRRVSTTRPARSSASCWADRQAPALITATGRSAGPRVR